MGCGIGVKRHRYDCVFERVFHSGFVVVAPVTFPIPGLTCSFLRRSNAACFQVFGARESERRRFRLERETKIEHRFVAGWFHGNRL